MCVLFELFILSSHKLSDTRQETQTPKRSPVPPGPQIAKLVLKPKHETAKVRFKLMLFITAKRTCVSFPPSFLPKEYIKNNN